MTTQTPMLSQSLSHRTIALPETRELDVLSGLLARRGAQIWRCPMVSIEDHPDQASVQAWLERFYAGNFDWLIVLTGEGLQRLFAAAERAGESERFITALRTVKIAARGPKPAKVLRTWGIKPDISPETATSAGIIAALSAANWHASSVSLQLYGEVENPALYDFLAKNSKQITKIAPYIYADKAADQHVLDLFEAIYLGKIDAIAFTSVAQIKRCLAVANQYSMDLPNLFGKICVAAIGPVVGDMLSSAGFKVNLQPEASFFMKPLVQSLADFFAQNP